MPKTNFKWNDPAISQLKRNVTKGLLRMGFAIASQARANAPYLTGALKNSIRVTADKSDLVYVLAGGTVAGKTINYAYIREKYNRRHPNTTHYLERAFDNVAKSNISQYFKEIG